MGKNKKTKHVFMIWIIVFVLLCTSVGAGIWWTKYGGEKWYRITLHRTSEPFTFRKTTSTSQLYSDGYFRNVLKKYSISEEKDLDIMEEESFPIPGLKATRSLVSKNAGEISICTSMTPQGIALSEKYIFISAYCYTHQHNSVIYVMDKETREFMKEIVLPEKTHVGSLAYDPEFDNLWVCTHDEVSHLAYVRSFTLSEMEAYSLDADKSAIRYSQTYPLVTQMRASFMNYHDRGLYVGLYNGKLSGKATIQRFEINDEGGLILHNNPMKQNYDDPEEIILPSSLAYINGGAQGFASDGETAIVMMSNGSKRDSHMMFFENEMDVEGNLDATQDNISYDYYLPVRAEQVYLDGGKVYICFESAAYAYRAEKSTHMDRILVFDWKK